MSNQVISILVFFTVIIAIISEKIHRTVAALAGMILLMLLHILDIEKAIDYIDFDTDCYNVCFYSLCPEPRRKKNEKSI